MKTITLIITIFFLSISPNYVNARGGSIKGNLLDELGQPVIGANVFLFVAGILRGSASDVDGKFHISSIPSGAYDLTITSIGFDTLRIKQVRVINDRVTMIRNKVLKYKTLGGFTLEEERWKIPLIDAEEPTAILYDAESLEKLPGLSDLPSLLATITPGVYQQNPGDPLQIRGARSGATTYFIDGVKTEGIATNFPSSSIGTIRVFTGGIPAMYGDVVGGVIIIETKSFLSWYNENHN